jgi:adenine-specific DNA-methyltransferase
LEPFKEQLTPKPKDWRPRKKDEKWKGRKPGKYQWYEIQDTVEYFEEFEKTKILWPGISS